MAKLILPNMIAKYIRKNNKTPKGALVAVPVSDNRYSIGWSFCHKNDTFEKAKALDIARNRALTKSISSYPELPLEVEKNLEDFKNRCTKYFRGRTLF